MKRSEAVIRRAVPVSCHICQPGSNLLLFFRVIVLFCVIGELL